MDKNIGFRRNIYLGWLDAAGAICGEERDSGMVRARLDPIVAQQIASKENRRMALDILLNIWVKTGESYPELRESAVKLYAESETPEARVALHYGLTLLAYPFFRLCAGIIGRMSQYEDVLGPKDVKQKVFADMGQLGALEKATERVIFSQRDWGLLAPGPKRYTFTPKREQVEIGSQPVEEWLLAAALTASPAEEMPFEDLVHLPELFPFQFAVTVGDLRKSPWFEVQRQGMGWDMVRRRVAPAFPAAKTPRARKLRAKTRPLAVAKEQ